LIQSTFRGGTESLRGRLLYRGAEADVVKGKWEGLDAVFKMRKPLRYRLPVLDNAIRFQRTMREAEMLHAAKRAGVSAPHLYYLDPRGATLVMEYVEGPRVRDVVSRLSSGEIEEVFETLGRSVAKLHAAKIVHGDLTTANLVKQDGRLVFLDFGLSLHTDRVEDHAVDLRLIKETIQGAHSAIADHALKSLFAGYRAGVGDARSKATLKQLRSIERRGRYARVV
jgi:TP53 regulating kinase and related kinases